MASNDLKGKNEYAYLLNEVNLIGVCEIIFLSNISHFGVKRVQTANKQTEITLIYIDLMNYYRFCAFTSTLINHDRFHQITSTLKIMYNFMHLHRL